MKSSKAKKPKKLQNKTPATQQNIKPAIIVDRSYYPAIPLANYPFAK